MILFGAQIDLLLGSSFIIPLYVTAENAGGFDHGREIIFQNAGSPQRVSACP
jgi:hypothetical protein